MKIELIVPERAAAGQDFVMRALLLNDSYEPVEVWRSAFVGPTATLPSGEPLPPSVEPTSAEPEQPLVLQPFTFYGRDRQSGPMEPGVVVVTATYRRGESDPVSTATEVIVS